MSLLAQQKDSGVLEKVVVVEGLCCVHNLKPEGFVDGCTWMQKRSKDYSKVFGFHNCESEVIFLLIKGRILENPFFMYGKLETLLRTRKVLGYALDLQVQMLRG